MNQEVLTRVDVLKELAINDDTLSMYELGLGFNLDPTSKGQEEFTTEDLQSIKLYHKLREAGLTYGEINMLGSFSEVLKNVDLSEIGDLKSLLNIYPIFRLKQSLNLARQELEVLRIKAQELEERLEEALDAKNGSLLLEAELEAREKTVTNLDRKLSEVLQQKASLESLLEVYRKGKQAPVVKDRRYKELNQSLTHKELELEEIKKENERLRIDLENSSGTSSELEERLERIEGEVRENEKVIDERYQEQIALLKAQIEELVSKKQKEWETYYRKTSETHRRELLVLQQRHEEEALRLKRKIKQQIEEIQQLRIRRNPLLGLIKFGEEQKKIDY